jgi:hypothetical protein
MNKHWIIGAIVGGLIVFIWQFLSWALVNIHQSNQRYTPNQEAILSCLQANITEDGSYYMPNVPPGTSSEDSQKAMEASFGKPWALVSYHRSNDASMGMNMLRGYTADVVAVFLLCWLFSFIPSIDIKKAITVCLIVGLTGYLTTEYSTAIWFKSNSIPDLIDAIIPWTLCGVWLGYWFNPNRR